MSDEQVFFVLVMYFIAVYIIIINLTNNEEMYRIDLLYFLAKCQCYQGDYDNSLINYKKYL